MSVHQAIILLCDHGEDCETGQIISPSNGIETARGTGAQRGWKRIGERDFCPDHLDDYRSVLANFPIARIGQLPPDQWRPRSMTDLMVICERCESEWGWGASADAAAEMVREHNHTKHGAEVIDAQQ
jgi:hypothetical protein